MPEADSTATETTATPGPWSVRVRPCVTGGGNIAYVTADTGHVEVCVIYADQKQIQNAGLIAAAPDYQALVDRAVAVLQRHAPPDGLSDHDAMSEFYGIFDGPAYRAAHAKAEGR